VNEDASVGDRGIDARLAKIVDRMLAPVVVVATDGRITYVNDSAAEVAERPVAWLVGRQVLDLVHPADRPKARRRLLAVASGQRHTRVASYRFRCSPSQEWKEVESYATNLVDEPGINGIVIAGRDVTDERRYQRRLRDAAYRDPLTGLPNNRDLHERLDRLLADSAPLAAGFVGLDRFNLINDSLGHANGDAVLDAVANRIGQSMPPACVTFRFNGDVFAVVAPGEAAEGARELLWSAVKRVGEPLFLGGHELRLSASGGLVYRDGSSTTDSLLRNADLALNTARARGGGRVELYEPSMGRAAVARLELEANLRLALSQSQFSLVFQPIVDIASGDPIWSEALLRWHDGPESISPSVFVPVAEETGLIVPIGDWVIDRAARLAARARGQSVHVNLSGRQLESPGLSNRIARLVSSHGLPAAALAFEVTETVLIEEFEYATGVLRSIRELGHRVGLDDFGTGYSSLSYLRRLPIDFLKVDRSLVAEVDSDAQARAIAGAIVTMGGALGLDVIAEGVETVAEARALEELGCRYGQGYLFARPAEL
jgi:diguanylate cyclase (GGDEF)-like protein/PAS domain S-box-containing protein